MINVEDNSLSFYFHISYLLYPCYVHFCHWDTIERFLFLFKCLSSCKCCDLMLLCLILLILLFPGKLFRLWLIISTSCWYWSFLGVMSDKKTSYLNFSLYSSANNFSLYARSSRCSLSISYILTWSKIFDGLLMLCDVILICYLPCQYYHKNCNSHCIWVI